MNVGTRTRIYVEQIDEDVSGVDMKDNSTDVKTTHKEPNTNYYDLLGCYAV